MEDIETRLRELATKWRDANREVHDVCRDAAEEFRVLRTKLQILEEMGKPRFYPNTTNFQSVLKDPVVVDETSQPWWSNTTTMGWGKGKDE